MNRMRKINPYKHERIQLKINRKALDGDQSALNNFVVRSRVTIQDMIDTYERTKTIDNDITIYDLALTIEEMEEKLKLKPFKDLANNYDAFIQSYETFKQQYEKFQENWFKNKI